MQYIISVIAAIGGLILGNWLSLLLYLPITSILGWLFPKAKGQNWGIFTLYISRACMGLTVSLLYYFFEYLGALRIIMTATFGIWALFLSEPFSAIQSHDLCKDNLPSYQRLRWNLKFARIIFYFIPSLILLGIAYILYK